MLSNPDVFILCETWQRSDEEFLLEQCYEHSDNYSHYSHARVSREGGGLCFIYKVNFHAKIIDFALTDTFEMLAIELKLHSKPYLFLVVYHIPGTSSLKFYDEFSEKVVPLALDYDEVICLGDFNLHFNTQNKYANLILELFSTLELSARVHEPTHKHGNTLDQVFLPTHYENCPMIVQQLDFSDHFLIEFGMPVSDKPKHRNRPFTYRNLK